MTKDKIYKVYYAQKGAVSHLSYVIVNAKNITEAKKQAKSKVWLDLRSAQKGAIQLNKFMKSLKFYI